MDEDLTLFENCSCEEENLGVPLLVNPKQKGLECDNCGGSDTQYTTSVWVRARGGAGKFVTQLKEHLRNSFTCPLPRKPRGITRIDFCAQTFPSVSCAATTPESRAAASFAKALARPGSSRQTAARRNVQRSARLTESAC
jgi:hypothetical protein